MAVDAVGIGEGELLQGLFQFVVTWPSTSRPEALRWSERRPFSLARSRARLSSMLRMASHSSLIAAASLGKCPRFLMILRSWKFSDSMLLVV